ncbi:MAG: hypothetical protein ABR607_07085 [Pyrinomonadaceae bacterium]
MNARDTKHLKAAQARWDKALQSFRTNIADLNRRINAWNLKAPAGGFQRNTIDVQREIDRFES